MEIKQYNLYASNLIKSAIECLYGNMYRQSAKTAVFVASEFFNKQSLDSYVEHVFQTLPHRKVMKLAGAMSIEVAKARGTLATDSQNKGLNDFEYDFNKAHAEYWARRDS